MSCSRAALPTVLWPRETPDPAPVSDRGVYPAWGFHGRISGSESSEPLLSDVHAEFFHGRYLPRVGVARVRDAGDLTWSELIERLA